MVIGQNTKKIIEIQLTDSNNALIDIDTIEAVEFCFDDKKSCHQIIKVWEKDRRDDEVTYDKETNLFLVILTQNNTKDWHNPRIPVQLRVKFIDGTVESTEPQMWNIRTSLSDEVL